MPDSAGEMANLGGVIAGETAREPGKYYSNCC